MRIGNNPHKDKPAELSEYLHQIIIPVYIPNFEGYFKDSFAILKLCLQSVFNTIHNKTFVTIVNNGSCDTIKIYLNQLLEENAIHEVIHTNNIGKLNAILKGLAGNSIELVTIADADVLFLPNWQQETIAIFRKLKKVGVVGIVPQFTMHKIYCENLIFDNFFNSKLKFLPVKNKEALVKFYDSIGWKRNYNPAYLEYALGLEIDATLQVLVGSGHFVATYKKDIFNTLVCNIPFKLGGNSENYLDTIPLKKDYWRVTTYNNFAFHLGNTIEDWMIDASNNNKHTTDFTSNYNFHRNTALSNIVYFFKIKVFKKLVMNKFVLKQFYKRKKLPKELIKNY